MSESSSPSRSIPERIKRQLRQESGFGCAKCGAPIIDYHHIVPWAERQEHRVEDIVVLCPNHHREVAKSPDKEARALKNNPYNIQRGFVSGRLTNRLNSSMMMVGSSQLHNVPTILQLNGKRSIGVDLREESLSLTVSLPEFDGLRDLNIVNNELDVRYEKFWDIEFKSNYLKLIHKERENYLTFDTRTSPASITGILSNDWYSIIFLKNHQRIRVGDSEITFTSSNFSDSKIALAMSY